MEGFHLFQEKIKGEVNQLNTRDFHMLPMSSEQSCWALWACEEEFYEIEEEPLMNFNIEYSEINHDVSFMLTDFRHIESLASPQNSDGKIILVYE